MTTNYRTDLKFVDCPFSDETNQKFINLLNSFLKDPAIVDVEITFEIENSNGSITVTNEGTDRLSADYARMYADLEASATKAVGTGNGKSRIKAEVKVTKGQ